MGPTLWPLCCPCRHRCLAGDQDVQGSWSPQWQHQKPKRLLEAREVAGGGVGTWQSRQQSRPAQSRSAGEGIGLPCPAGVTPRSEGRGPGLPKIKCMWNKKQYLYNQPKPLSPLPPPWGITLVVTQPCLCLVGTPGVGREGKCLPEGAWEA